MKKIILLLFGLISFFTYTQNVIVNGVKFITSDSIYAIIKSDMTIENDGTIIINPHTLLNVTGTITNNVGNNGIIIKSSPTKPNGTFIFGNDQNTPLIGSVEYYSKANWDLTRPVNNKYKWQFFGVPVKSFTINSTLNNSYIRKYNETGNGSGLTSDKRWIQLNSGDVLTSETGYEIVQETEKTYTFTGQLINNDISKTLTYTPTSDYPGQHILSNPYTSAIDIKKISFGADMDSTIYFYNTGSYNDWYNNQSSTGGNPGQYYSIPQKLAGQSGLQSTIPSMQGFLVKTKSTSTTNATINIPYVTSVLKNSEMQRVSKVIEDIPSIVITAEGTKYNDVMWIFKVDGKTNHYDNGWDGKKMFGSIYSPQIYSVGDDGQYQVNSINHINNLIIGFKNGQDSIYKLCLKLSNIINDYPNLFLVDLQNNSTIQIIEDSLVYEFEPNLIVDIKDRFLITTSIETNINTHGDNSIMVYNIDKTIFVKNNSDSNRIIKIYNINGQQLGIYNSYQNNTTIINTDLDKGIYFIDYGIKITKIIIK